MLMGCETEAIYPSIARPAFNFVKSLVALSSMARESMAPA